MVEENNKVEAVESKRKLEEVYQVEGRKVIVQMKEAYDELIGPYINSLKSDIDLVKQITADEIAFWSSVEGIIGL